MGRTLFGTDGIRGLANQGVMTPETAFRIGAASLSMAARVSGASRCPAVRVRKVRTAVIRDPIAGG